MGVHLSSQVNFALTMTWVACKNDQLINVAVLGFTNWCKTDI